MSDVSQAELVILDVFAAIEAKVRILESELHTAVRGWRQAQKEREMAQSSLAQMTVQYKCLLYLRSKERRSLESKRRLDRGRNHV